MSDEGGLLSRWSRRKAQARGGNLPVEPARAPPDPQAPAAQPPVTAAPSTPNDGAVAAPPPPTLNDVALLTKDSDYSRFVLPGVDESVKRAAVKKLFSDPQFNVMDGLDIYIDDYGKPDPIPEEMLRRMTQSKLLRLFDAEEAPPEALVSATGTATSSVGAAAPALPPSSPVDTTEPVSHLDEDTALRLQPDDAAGPAGSGPDRAGPRP
jgi:hypothetical protein